MNSMGVIDGAIEKIKQMLVDGRLRPGDKLPVEPELAAQLGVSRSTVREAVRALSTIRVLRTRWGDGTYVTSLTPDLLLDGMSFVVDLVDLHQADGALQFLQVRRLLEPEATALAASRMGSAELTQLAHLLAESDELANRTVIDHERMVAVDHSFHSLITAHCGNPVLAALVENTSGRTVRARVWRSILEEGAGVAKRTVDEHRTIYQALVDRAPVRARLRATVHILGVEDALRGARPDDSGGDLKAESP